MEFLPKLRKYFKGDIAIWCIILVLSFLSALAVYSATRSLAWRSDKSNAHFLFKQFSSLGFGLFIIFVIHKIKYTNFVKWSKLLYVISLPLLVYTFFFGVSLNQGSRWIIIPLIGLTIQTSDLAKLALFLYLSRQLSIRQDTIKDLKKGFIPVLLPVLATCFCISWANMSTALLLGVTCCILFFIGRIQVKHILMLAGVGLALALTIFSVSKITGIGRGSTWEKRINVFINADEADEDSKYQTEQAKIAIANGGVFGVGPGNSYARDFLPHPYSDFIFAIIIEEYGIVGGATLIFVYILFLWRSILIFQRCPYAFGAFLSVALSFTLVFQAMLNMAVNVNLVPVTGLTLPFVSMGGSSIIFTSISIGIILSVSRYVDEMEGSAKQIKEVVS